VEAYGTIDELSSALGMARHLCLQDDVIYAIDYIQRLLFRVAGELASLGVPFDRPINEEDERMIEERTNRIEAQIPLKSFVVPGMTNGSAASTSRVPLLAELSAGLLRFQGLSLFHRHFFGS